MIKAEIITIGDEILYGQITDTNSQWISAELDKIGVRTIRKSSIGDAEEEILQIFKESQARADIVLITGGLGPTKDDITKKTFCKYFGTQMQVREDALAHLLLFCEKRNYIPTPIILTQAELPSNATYLHNKLGTAPGMWFEHEGTVFVSMPGVPFEMKGLITDSVIPKIKEHFSTPHIFHKIIRTVGTGETVLAERISEWEDALPPHLKVAYLPSIGQVKLRLTGFGNDLQAIEKEVLAKVDEMLPMIQEFVYGFDDEELEVAIGNQLMKKHQTVSVAESCTGGYLSHLFTRNSGSSAYFFGGVVAYDNSVKINQLGVLAETIEKNGAVSEETVIEMAQNVRKRLKTTFGLATTGIAGPNGGTHQKPVGTIWIALASENETITHKLQLGGKREQNIISTASSVLNLLRKKLIERFTN
jgi:nicotinamide-nucleotide amidase